MADETPKPVEKQADEAAAQVKFRDPYEFLATFEGAPSRAQIDEWKAQTPNGRLRIITPDGGKRVFIVRAISGLELQKLQANMPQNMDPVKAETEVQMQVVSLCTVWTNVTKGKMNPEILKAGSAGLPTTLFNLISYISDFVDPEAFSVISADL